MLDNASHPVSLKLNEIEEKIINNDIAKNCPGIGWKYDSEKDAFIPPDSLKPYPSWVWDDSICWWKSPVDEPTDGITDEEAAGQKDENGVYTVLPYYWIWDESSTNWKKTNEKA